MKFHFFHLMPYPELPADLRDRYRSVWVDLPVKEIYDPVVGNRAYHEYLDELEYADSVGFDGICVNEHHQNGYGGMPSPNLMAATLARRTSSSNIVVLGNTVPLYNPPTRIAEEFAMLDVLSGGRLVAGMPLGSAMDTAYAMGQSPTTLREKYREGVDLITRAWKADEPFAFNGKYTQLRYVNPWPRPIQQPHPPIWIPGTGSVETWSWCAENDYLYAYLSFFGYAGAQKMMDGYWDVVAEQGGERNPFSAGFVQTVAVADSDAHAEDLYSEAATYFYNRCLYLYPGFVSPPGYMSEASMRKGIEGQMQQAAAMSPDLTWNQMIERGYIIAGHPDTVTEQLNELTTNLNVGQLMLLLHFGNLSRERTMDNIARFASDVAPRLRSKFSEYEDRWTPRAVQPAGTTHLGGTK
ncbi:MULTISPECIES: LLM class flavin-dependent oxidoreductase [unclassified Mycobacterium]|uniref:LLM class flavin-dependent oxidoreductase n=1 Tax=unclassified Mycobacterium TaxID=2642494 RepID=UPI0029C619C9|nr:MULTISPECIES: LLM class flavin-dependent oxidoreductase [unclassified Mycobacterium]